MMAVCRVLSGLILTCGMIAGAQAATVSPVQSTAMPLGVAATRSVMLAGSDSRAALFQTQALPGLAQVAQQTLGERVVLANPGAFRVFPDRITMAASVIPRIYFVSEGAGYHNALFAASVAPGASVTQLQWHLVFANASSPDGHGGGGGDRRDSAPLRAGDFVDMGLSFAAGDRLAFKLVANGARGGKEGLGTEIPLNSDGLQHVVGLSLPAAQKAGTVLLGFEDLRGGGDRDFNDLVIAVDLGQPTTESFDPAPAPVPVPGSGVILLVALGVAGAFRISRRAV